MAAKSDSSPTDRSEALRRLVREYRPLPGAYDELMTAKGELRPHWLPLLDRLAELGEDEIGRRFAAADRHLKEFGRVLPGL